MAYDYDLIVIGAGAAGLTAAGFMGKAGGKVALIERKALGGDCTWTGCVPSKALLKVSKMAHTLQTASKYGVNGAGDGLSVDMGVVRDYVKRVVNDVYAGETPEVFSRDYNVEVIEGEARFVDEHTVAVSDRRLTSGKFVIAVGASAAIPKIEGLSDVTYFTNETLFDNDHLPQRLLIIGAGPVGTEIAQAYARLGAKVTLIDQALLPRDEPEVAEVMQAVLTRDGVQFEPGLVSKAAQAGETISLTLESGAVHEGDMLLVAAGRAPNLSVGLEQAGVAYTRRGILVDDYLRTNVKHIYAVGDCTDGPKFTHYAGFQGGIAGRNATLPLLNAKGRTNTLPWVTFTDPEVAHIGMTEQEARQAHGRRIGVYHFSLDHGDRTRAEDDLDGFIKLVHKGNKLLGATVVAGRAGEMIFELGLAVQGVISLRDITSMIHAYPTYSDVVRRAVANLTVQQLFSGLSGRAISTFGRLLFRR